MVVLNNNVQRNVNDDHSTQYWNSEETHCQLMIDFSLANQPISKWAILAKSLASGSDPMVCGWEEDIGKQQEEEYRWEVE